MARDWRVSSGVFVLAAGVLAVGGLLRMEQPPAEPAPVTADASAPVPVSSEPPVSMAPELPGVPSQISRVLDWNGNTEFASDDELGELPPAVAAVLTEYEVPLRIPMTGDRE